MNRHNLGTFKEKLAGIQARVSQLNAKFHDQEGCSNILLAKAVSAERAEYQRDYQKERRFAAALKKGRFSDKHAVWLATEITAREAAAEAFWASDQTVATCTLYWPSPPRLSASNVGGIGPASLQRDSSQR